MSNRSTIENLSGLVNQFKENSFEGFTVDIDDGRDFADVVKNGKGISDINLYNKGFNDAEELEGFGDWLEDQKVGVYAKGRKLFEQDITATDIRFGGSSEEIIFGDPKNRNYDNNRINDVFPDEVVKKMPKGLRKEGIRDFAKAYNIDKLSFKPIQNTSPKQSSSPEETVEKASKQVKNSNFVKTSVLGLLAIPVILYVGYRVVR